MDAEKVLSALYSSEADSSSDEECSTNCEEDFAVSETMNPVKGRAPNSNEEVSFSTVALSKQD